MAIVRPEAIDDAPADGPPLRLCNGVSPGRSAAEDGGCRLFCFAMQSARSARRKIVGSRHCGIGDRGAAILRPDQAIRGRVRRATWTDRDGMWRHSGPDGKASATPGAERHAEAQDRRQTGGMAAGWRVGVAAAARFGLREGRPPRPAVVVTNGRSDCRHESHLTEGANRPLTVHRRRGRARCALRLRPCNPARSWTRQYFRRERSVAGRTRAEGPLTRRPSATASVFRGNFVARCSRRTIMWTGR